MRSPLLAVEMLAMEMVRSVLSARMPTSGDGLNRTIVQCTRNAVHDEVAAAVVWQFVALCSGEAGQGALHDKSLIRLFSD